MAALIPQKMFDEQLAAMDIENFAQATITTAATPICAPSGGTSPGMRLRMGGPGGFR